MHTFDFAIIGGGIVGVSTAWQLQQRHPDARIALIEKETTLAQHQTGRNSGVIHAGVYYQPGSLKADFCKRGAAATMAFCREHSLPYEQCGKLLVATDALERDRMDALQVRCGQNDIAVEPLSAAALRRKEPNIKGIGALFVPATGITDYQRITRKMAERFQASGGRLLIGQQVHAITETHTMVRLGLNGRVIEAGYVIACGGLMADRLAKMAGIRIHFQIIPFRGEYYRLASRHNGIVNHLIYPIPDPELPFLGVHLTRMIDGSVTVGPNAVLGYKREGYGAINFNPQDIGDMARFSGFWRLLTHNWRSGLSETIDSWWKKGYLNRVRRYCPSLTAADFEPYPVGIRAQAVLPDGSLVHDFLFAETRRSLHVCNAPSPAATSAIPIGAHLCDKVAAAWDR